MARVLAYTSPALGHMLPISALLCELSRRGHDVHLRTLSTAVEVGAGFGLRTDRIDPRIAAITMDDWKGHTRSSALKQGVSAFARRAAYEPADLRDAMQRFRPDFLLIDVNCWGALSAAETAGLPWASFAPYTPPLRAAGLPPFGPGLAPMSGIAGRVRDAALSMIVTRSIETVLLPAINAGRKTLGLNALGSVDEFLRRAPLMLIASGSPFQYPGIQWGDSIHLIGPCIQEAGPATPPDWLVAIDRPIVLVTTSSEKQADDTLVTAAVEALSGEGVHVIATLPAGHPESDSPHDHVTLRRFVPHTMVLEKAVCAITHGGMGATQKALAYGVPVCVVPFGRDQFEVARRVEVARCGTRLPGSKLSAARLHAKVTEATGMTAGAQRVAEGFAATGGVAHGADLIEATL